MTSMTKQPRWPKKKPQHTIPLISTTFSQVEADLGHTRQLNGMSIDEMIKHEGRKWIVWNAGRRSGSSKRIEVVDVFNDRSEAASYMTGLRVHLGSVK
mmetsp:Transcript_14261/g.41857  ORF Transcript_14261/g.41857 Transcript_14261/m.41857 type:complete len:98 (-) Transcript_14261:705-998(-)|eukprot:CAMPEP_0113567066 /NCGR_PEP_ID=MMETSP0015_2-20120614/23071_1 /TAXON_ID=2838 /ORGANISM="Odontella" /LENGTH=97 /DNA_ID=CAMNT_0000469423 /DNA_START=5 /DNA_END=298 /DNA_ORIENTATION=- /assembly_acc=CAM_ASM_000160